MEKPIQTDISAIKLILSNYLPHQYGADGEVCSTSTTNIEDGLQNGLSSIQFLTDSDSSGMTIGIIRVLPKLLESPNSSRLECLQIN